ncbi:hypothetical protein CG723_30980 [Streptomyces sp. CB01635]|uniref:hypothetical protein n=1 Tax=unclassified Streptomyces TaxID=2593676 RepID=UPI000C2700C0|nr:hypothetical protein [Streptomyces sp. CB01635]PJN07833.1 hypothetical protein CG723_30980 [Streptomyces sp. CB01635]
MGKHSPRRARVVFYDVAREQIQTMPRADLDRLDAVLDVIASDPTVGTATKHGSVREYQRAGVRVIYIPTALGTLVLVAYVEA